MPLGILLAGAAMGSAGLFENYWAIFAMVTVSGIGSAIFHPEAARMIHKLSGTRRGTAMSIFSVGGNGGFAAGPVIAVAAITAFGTKGTAVFCLLALIMAMILLVIVPKMKADIAQTSVSEVPADAKVTEPKSELRNDWPSLVRPI